MVVKEIPVLLLTVILILSDRCILLAISELLIVDRMIRIEGILIHLVQTQLIVGQQFVPNKSTHVALITDWRHDRCIEESVDCPCSWDPIDRTVGTVLVPGRTLVISAVVLDGKEDFAFVTLNAVV